MNQDQNFVSLYTYIYLDPLYEPKRTLHANSAMITIKHNTSVLMKEK
jgi:hypothetical protein